MKNILEELLQKMGLSPEQIARARELQEREGGFLREHLIEQGALTQDDFAQRSSQILRVPYLNVADQKIPDAVLQLLPQEKAESYLALPVEADQKFRRITIAMADPTDMQALDELKFVIGHTLIPNFCPEDELKDQIQQHYIRLEERLLNAASGFAQATPGEERHSRSLDVERLVENEQALAKLLGRTLSIANSKGAHEIRFKALPDHGLVEFALDGKTVEFTRLPSPVYTHLITRLKRELGAEFRESHDLCATGFCRLELSTQKRSNLSYQFYRSFHGEESLIKLKDRLSFDSLQQMGLPAVDIAAFEDALDARDGAILLSGTVRSGLTSSLYSVLSLIDPIERNILSVELPVEYQLDGIFQAQASDEADSSREQYVQKLLEHAPDVVMLDRVSDQEMAKLFLQLSSGSLVLSTLIATDAAAAFMKLSAMTSPEFVLERLRCLIAQRLVKQICPECKEEVVLADAYREKLGLEAEDKCYVGKGCEHCGQSGYKGAVPIFEFLALTEDTRRVLQEGRNVQECRQHLFQHTERRSLRDAGMEKVREGITTVQEVIRTTIV